MLTIISPAKSLDFDSKVATKKNSNPQFLPEASELMGSLRKLSPAKISSLMSISDKLAMKTFKGLMMENSFQVGQFKASYLCL